MTILKFGRKKQRQRKRQIAFGDDNKKTKARNKNSKGKGGVLPLRQAQGQNDKVLRELIPYASMRNWPSLMICSSRPSASPSQMLNSRPTTSMWVEDFQGAPVWAP